MATREEYTACMRPHLTGTGKSKEQRQLDMCTGAKLCSGRAARVEEAQKICRELPPKEPKPQKSRAGKGSINVPNLASCLSTKIDIEGLTAENLPVRLESALKTCVAGKPTSKTSYKRFMNACLKENGGGGDFKTAQSDIKKCQIRWNETRGA